jgi:hypothetical protein
VDEDYVEPEDKEEEEDDDSNEKWPWGIASLFSLFGVSMPKAEK